jgi:AraC family transcriptional activator of pobA
MVHFKNLSNFHESRGYQPPENPMLSLVTCNSSAEVNLESFSTDFYMIVFKKIRSGSFSYGKTLYDHNGGSMLFHKPLQIIEIKNLIYEENAFIIHFHKDYLIGHPLHNEIKKFGFFEYTVNEALHLSPKEEQTIWDVYYKIKIEYDNNEDIHSKSIVLSLLEGILRYSERFYFRQFLNRKAHSGAMVSRFQDLLSNYFTSGELESKGLPSVMYMANRLQISPGYLSDLLKQETGKTALELIHLFLLSEAKNLLKSTNHSIKEISYMLGFNNPPYFSRLFKKESGQTPNQFKKQILN